MMIFSRKDVTIFFNICCIVALIFMIGYWFYKYEIQDRDIGVVDYRTFKQEENIKYPIVSICFRNPIVEYKLKDINDQINVSTYVKYLKGEIVGDKLRYIDYQNVSLQFQDYFLSAFEKWFNQSKYHKSSSSFEYINTFNGIYNYKFIKCFSVRITNNDYRHIKSMVFFYNKQKLKRDLAIEDAKESSYYVSLHYPGQFLLGDEILGSVSMDESFALEAHEIEILKRRSNHRHPCFNDNVQYDDRILIEHLSRKKCRPTYLNAKNGIPICSTMNKTKQSTFDYWGIRSLEIADDCLMISKKTVSKITMNYLNNETNSLMRLGIIHPKTFRIITLSKEIDIHTLVGNIGGYLGLFLGNFWSLLEYRINF